LDEGIVAQVQVGSIGWIDIDQHSCCIRAHATLNVTVEVLDRTDDGWSERRYFSAMLWRSAHLGSSE
jgi:hypothetical protein